MNTPVVQSEWIEYDYAIVRVVPHVHRGTCIDIGVVLFARTADYLEALFVADLELITRRFSDLDSVLLKRFIDAYGRVCEGGSDAGPIGLLPCSERFHWLTAPRSAVVQTSPVHPGRSRDLLGTLERLFREHCS